MAHKHTHTQRDVMSGSHSFTIPKARLTHFQYITRVWYTYYLLNAELKIRFHRSNIQTTCSFVEMAAKWKDPLKERWVFFFNFLFFFLSALSVIKNSTIKNPDQVQSNCIFKDGLIEIDGNHFVSWNVAFWKAVYSLQKPVKVIELESSTVQYRDQSNKLYRW